MVFELWGPCYKRSLLCRAQFHILIFLKMTNTEAGECSGLFWFICLDVIIEHFANVIISEELDAVIGIVFDEWLGSECHCCVYLVLVYEIEGKRWWLFNLFYRCILLDKLGRMISLSKWSIGGQSTPEKESHQQKPLAPLLYRVLPVSRWGPDQWEHMYVS